LSRPDLIRRWAAKSSPDVWTVEEDPGDAPDFDTSGFDFWLQKLDGFGGDFRQAQMVEAFITSPAVTGARSRRPRHVAGPTPSTLT